MSEPRGFKTDAQLEAERYERALEKRERRDQRQAWRDLIEGGAFFPFTAVECDLILAGGAPRLAIDARVGSELATGEEIQLSPRLAIRITRRTRTRKGEIKFTYTIIDDRDVYLRRVPPADPPKRGSYHQPDEEEIRRAAALSAYDGNPRDPVDAGQVVGSAAHNVLVTKARAKFAEHRLDEAPKDRATELSRQVEKELRAVAVGIAGLGGDPVEFLATVKSQIAEQRESMKDAA